MKIASNADRMIVFVWNATGNESAIKTTLDFSLHRNESVVEQLRLSL